MHSKKVTHLKSIPHRSALPSTLSTQIEKGRESRKVPVPPFSSGGAFKAVQKVEGDSSSVPRVHRLSKSLQKMGLGGSQQTLPDSGSLISQEAAGAIDGSPSIRRESPNEEPKKALQSTSQTPTKEVVRKEELISAANQSTMKARAEKSIVPHPTQNAQESKNMYVQDYDSTAGQYMPPHMMPHQHSPQLGPNGAPYMQRQQYLQPNAYSPGQYSFPSPQFGPGVPTMAMPMPHLQLQPPTMPPHMVQQKPYMHPAYSGNYPGAMVNAEGNMDPSQMRFRGHPSQYGSPADYGNMMPMRYASNEIQFAPQAPQNSNKKHDSSRGGRALPPSLQELQGKLNMLLNHSGNNTGEIDQLLPLFEGRILVLAKTQCGSRFLQQRIAEGHPGYFSLVMKEVFTDLPGLMVDLFGNYLCQKLIEKCNEQQRDSMLRKLLGHVPDISCDRQGTRAVQKIVGASTTLHQREIFMGSITREADLLKLMRDSNGSHVIHAVLDKFPLSMLSPIFKLAYKTCYKLAVHQHGLCVLKKCMTLAKPEDFMDISNKILQKVLFLVNDQYGNYLIQHIIDRSIINKQNAIDQGDMKSGQYSPEKAGDAINMLHSKLSGHYCRLSKQKFSSNVVEKCLRVGSSGWQVRIIDELMDKKNGNSVLSLLQDSFGNYVMQNALNVAESNQAADLVRLIKPHLTALRKNIRKKWERLITAKCSSLAGGGEMPKQILGPSGHNGGHNNNSSHGGSHSHKQRGSNRHGHGGRNGRHGHGQNQHHQKHNNHHNRNSQSQQSQQQQQQQDQRNWAPQNNFQAPHGYADPYNAATYTQHPNGSNMANRMQQIHDALIRIQPAQAQAMHAAAAAGQMPHPNSRPNMHPQAGQMHPAQAAQMQAMNVNTAQMQANMQANVMHAYPQGAYVPQIQYAQPQPNQMFIEHHQPSY
mmetsp:Transcript_20246/g.36056  ORF Transcript_20246/g.36056 Transcript_20246/m.36056 type:complete len:924 (+) Transcript_20246:1-2772(+)